MTGCSSGLTDTDLATEATGKEMTGVSAGLTDTDLATEVTGTGASSGVTVDTMPAIDPTPKAP